MNNLDIPAWAVDSDSDSDDGKDIEMQETKGDDNNYMQTFFNEMDALSKNIKDISQATKEIGIINDRSMQATTTAEEKKLSQQLTPLIRETNQKAKQTKTHLGLLKEETENKKKEETLSPSHLRSCETMINTLTRKFVDEMKSYQQAQDKYKRDIKNKVKRQVQNVKADATDEEIEEVLKSDGGRDALYKKTILAGGVNDQVKTAYAKVAGKYQDVLTLEQSIAELHQMFMDFALLTEQQGELLDQIEFNVAQATDHVEEANVQVHEAIEYQKSVRKKQCTILLIVTVAAAIVIWLVFK